MVDLPENHEPAARTILALLSDNEWLDMQTRALFIEFSLATSTGLVLAARLVAEVHETGTVWTDHLLEPINFQNYAAAETWQPSTRWVLALYIIFFIFIVLCLLWDLRSTWDLRWYQDRRTGAVRPCTGLPKRSFLQQVHAESLTTIKRMDWCADRNVDCGDTCSLCLDRCCNRCSPLEHEGSKQC